MPSNTTQITPPRVPLTDERTGAVSREWYRWFYNLYTITGEGLGITPVINGGTGLSTIPTNGQLLIGNGTGYTLNTLTASSGITVTNATGTITIANSGVLSFSGGATGLTPASATTGAVTLAGTLAIANGGTNGSATPTAYGVSYGTGTAYAFTSAGTTKQALLANTGSAPTWSTLTTGSSILYGDGSGGFSNVTIGSGVSFAGGTLSATGSGGTVTSVTGTSPVVSSGGTTPAISLAAAYGDTLNPYGTKTAAYVLAGPATGAATAPTFRALVSTDIPSLSYVTSVGATAPITSTGGLTPTIGVTSAALSKTDDTNVTMTLGGSPTTALLAATSLTLGWAGQLSVGRGGTGLSAGTSGGIPYFSSTSAMASSALLTQYGVVYGGGAGASPVATAAGTTGQVLTATTGAAPTWAAPATSGTVTSVSVVSANGFAGTVATATSTPAITLTTTITGVLKGNGTAISAAVPNTDYIAPSAVVIKTANFTLADTENWVINNKTGSACTVTLPAASSWSGRSVMFTNYQAQTLVSASSNVVPLGGGSADTAILLGVVGNWATLVSDGTNWIIMQAAPNNILLLE